MKKLFPLLLAFSLISCKPAVKLAYGIKKPKEESKKTLVKYLDSKSIKTDNVLLVDTDTSYVKYIKDFDGIPEAILFNADGNQVTYKADDQECSAGLYGTLPTLNSSSDLRKLDGRNLQAFVSNLTDLDGNQIGTPAEADYYLFIGWAKFTGRLNEEHVKAWEELADNNEAVNIQVYKVNLDFKEGWEISVNR